MSADCELDMSRCDLIAGDVLPDIIWLHLSVWATVEYEVTRARHELWQLDNNSLTHPWIGILKPFYAVCSVIYDFFILLFMFLLCLYLAEKWGLHVLPLFLPDFFCFCFFFFCILFSSSIWAKFLITAVIDSDVQEGPVAPPHVPVVEKPTKVPSREPKRVLKCPFFHPCPSKSLCSLWQ